MKWIRSNLTSDGAGEGEAGREEGRARDLERRKERREAQAARNGEKRGTEGEKGEGDFLPKRFPKKPTPKESVSFLFKEVQTSGRQETAAKALPRRWMVAAVQPLPTAQGFAGVREPQGCDTAVLRTGSTLPLPHSQL